MEVESYTKEVKNSKKKWIRKTKDSIKINLKSNSLKKNKCHSIQAKSCFVIMRLPNGTSYGDLNYLSAQCSSYVQS